MSGNAAKVYTWLVANAGRRGTVGTDFSKIARENGLSYSTLRRTVRELASKNLIAITSAANQHKATTITISAALTDGRTNHLPAALTDERGNILPEPTESSTPAPSAVLTGERGDTEPAVFTDERSECPNSRETKAQRADRLAAEIATGGHLAGELDDRAQRALAHLGFGCEWRFVSIGFAAAVAVLYDIHGETLSPGKFAGKIITTCLSEQQELGAQGKDPVRYCWPPGFRKWRGVLRDREKRAEQVAMVP
jgi:hypothetical protein